MRAIIVIVVVILLIIVSYFVIGIGAGLLIPKYKNAKSKEKIEQLKANYKDVFNYVSSVVYTCEQVRSAVQIGKKTLECRYDPRDMAKMVADYYNVELGYKNPYDKKLHAVYSQKYENVVGAIYIDAISDIKKGNIIISANFDFNNDADSADEGEVVSNLCCSFE